MKTVDKKRRTLQGMVAAVLIGMVASSAGAQAVFTYPDFSSINGLTLNGSAIQTGSTLTATPPVRSVAGSAWYSTPVPVGGDWSSSFHFRIRDINGQGADGFAFVVQGSAAGATAIGGRGGALGYATNPVFSSQPGNSGITNCLAVEFDTWDNTGDWSDFGSSRHVSIQSMGVQDNLPTAGASLVHASLGADFADSAVHQVLVSYTGGTMNVFMDANLLLTASYDLQTQLGLAGGQAWVGFTAGTGAIQNVERHEILDWDFNVIPGPSSGLLLAAALMAGGLARTRRGD